VQAYRPVTIQLFRDSWAINVAGGLLNTFSGVREVGLVVEEDKDRHVVATARLRATTRGIGMNECRMTLDPERAELASALVSASLSTIRQLSPRNRVRCAVETWQPELLDAALAGGFTPQFEDLRLGMKLA
jgi:hypothetical protein